MDINTRLRINQLVDDITDVKSEFFNAAQARELIDIVPFHIRSGFFSFSLSVIKDSSSSHSGYSPGVGNVSVGDDRKEEKKEFTYNRLPVWKIGGYEITHEPGKITIGLMWRETLEDESGTECRLVYNKATKAPVRLDVLKDNLLDIPFYIPGLMEPNYISVGVSSWLPYKKPQLLLTP